MQLYDSNKPVYNVSWKIKMNVLNSIYIKGQEFRWEPLIIARIFTGLRIILNGR